MFMSISPHPPPLSPLRLATLSDIPRLAVVAAAGFYHSPFFCYQRPGFASFPADTLSSYRAMYSKQILDPQYVVVVAADALSKDEARECYEALAGIYPSLESQIPEECLRAGRAIVAVAGLRLQGGSGYLGGFQTEAPGTKDPYNHPRKRDQNSVAGKLLEEAMHECEARAFANKQVIDTMVVHPAYWRRHHGTDLTQWMIELAGTEDVGLGVAAATMGRLLFEQEGFVEEVVEIPGYSEHLESIYAWLGLCDKGMQGGKEVVAEI